VGHWVGGEIGTKDMMASVWGFNIEYKEPSAHFFPPYTVSQFYRPGHLPEQDGFPIQTLLFNRKLGRRIDQRRQGSYTANTTYPRTRSLYTCSPSTCSPRPRSRQTRSPRRW
jgi:hypothetical protein